MPWIIARLRAGLAATLEEITAMGSRVDQSAVLDRFIVLCAIKHGAIAGDENGRLWYVGGVALLKRSLFGIRRSKCLRRISAEPDQLVCGRYALHENELMAVSRQIIDTPLGKYALICGYSPKTMTWACTGEPERVDGVNVIAAGLLCLSLSQRTYLLSPRPRHPTGRQED